ncbi:MAG: hypothetical protein J0M24_01335 [Verrucomicrobia bacterium]|nr:hypothetical protein [Verrucomicrobiota bacterium]
MQINALKPTTRFVNGAKLKCLVGKIHLTGFDGGRSGMVAITVPKSGSKLYLVGGDGVSTSVWHREELDRLKEDTASLNKLETALEDHVARIMSPAERRQNGLKPVVKLTVDAVVLDDVCKLALLIFASDEMDIDEHGLVAVQENANWRLETGDFVSGYGGDAALPESKDTVSPLVNLIGTWQFDEKATADLLRRQGDSESFIRMSLKNLRGTEWVVTESEIFQKHPTYRHEYKVVAVESKMGFCQITVNAPGLTTPEVWKVKIKNDQMVGVGGVLKKQQTASN